MTEQIINDFLLNKLPITNFNNIDLIFLLNNQYYNNLELTANCFTCESFFIKFIKLFNSNIFYIYVNLNCICIYNNILIFNVSYIYAI